MKTLLVWVNILLLFSACATHTHTIGNGPKENATEIKRQYYALYGLVPLNKVDTNAMVGDAKNYRLETGAKLVDIAIGVFGTSISIQSRSVKVTK